jgi:uncharacterized protein (DUF849 family)
MEERSANDCMGTASATPLSSDRVIVTCALSGVLANRDQCPGIPYTPTEMAEEARRACDAGAAVVHIHARNDDGTPTFDPAVFWRIGEQVRAQSDAILNFSTGTLEEDTRQQEQTLRESRPELAALNMGTMNYAKYSHKRRDFVFDLVFPNTFAKIKRLLNTMNDVGVKPELECFDCGHTHSIWPLLDMGVLKPPVHFSFIMGVLGGIPSTVEALMLQARQIPSSSTWEVIGIGRQQWRMIATALVLGGNIRIGLEDNFYLPNGDMAISNGVLVDKAVSMCRDVGREPASVREARRILSLE